MNQISTGNYIAKKRRALNLTQEQLAETVGVSNKTVSKWENGRCMPDYGIIEKLCETLNVTLTELMDGKDAAETGTRSCDDDRILDLLRRTQELERQRRALSGALLIVLGIASSALSGTVGGTDVKDFISGLLLGPSIVEIAAGLVIAVKTMTIK